jgi:hypothetical protein
MFSGYNHNYGFKFIVFAVSNMAVLWDFGVMYGDRE